MKRRSKKSPGKKAEFVSVLREKVKEKVLHLKALISTYVRSFARKRKIPLDVIKRVHDYLSEILTKLKEHTIPVLADMWKSARGLA